MYRNKTFNRKKVMIVFVAVFFIMMFLIGRLVYLMIFCSEYYGNKAENLHERERDIKAARGKLLDACLLYTSPSPRDVEESRMPSSA